MDLDLFEPNAVEETPEARVSVSRRDVKKMLARRRLELRAEQAQLNEDLYDVLTDLDAEFSSRERKRPEVAQTRRARALH